MAASNGCHHYSRLNRQSIESKTSMEGVDMKSLAIICLVFMTSTLHAADVEVGSVDQKMPEKKALVAPKNDKGIQIVGLNETIIGKVPAGEKRNLYVMIMPLVGEDWWVQQTVTRKENTFEAEAQFGEEDGGKGEYFVVLAIATEKKWLVGEKLSSIPADASYTAIKIVKRRQ